MQAERCMDPIDTFAMCIKFDLLLTETKTANVVSLPRDKLMKHHKLAPCLKEKRSAHEVCIAMQHAIIDWMKGTPYPVASCIVDVAGESDLKATITLGKGAKPWDAHKFQLALGLV
jgi:hypothetical protein